MEEIPEAPAGPAPISRDAAFRRASRHSRRVRLLRTAVPVATVLIALSFVAFSYLSVPKGVSFDVSESSFTAGKLVMASPKLEGFTSNNQAYSMTAARALQHIDQTGIVELEGIAARLPVSETIVAMINTAQGVYDRDQNILDIPTPIKAETNDNMTISLQSAYMDIEQGCLTTEKSVDVQMRGVSLKAGAMSVIDGGKVLVFENRVTMNIQPTLLGEGKTDRAATGAVKPDAKQAKEVSEAVVAQAPALAPTEPAVEAKKSGRSDNCAERLLRAEDVIPQG